MLFQYLQFVRYFSFFTKWWIIMKNAFYIIEKALFVIEIFRFLYFGLLFFSLVGHCFRGWSKINLKFQVNTVSRTSFRVNLHSIVCLNIEELLARSRRHIWSLSDSNGIRTHNHLVRKRTHKHLAKTGQFG